MTEQTQQELLREAKKELGCTWDKLAEITGITPRALKTYRMPITSKDYRPISQLAENAVKLAIKSSKNQQK